MKKILIYIGLSIFILAAIFGFLRMVVGGGEDTWICDDGEWVKHGAPSTSRPEGGCGN